MEHPGEFAPRLEKSRNARALKRVSGRNDFIGSQNWLFLPVEGVLFDREKNLSAERFLEDYGLGIR